MSIYPSIQNEISPINNLEMLTNNKMNINLFQSNKNNCQKRERDPVKNQINFTFLEMFCVKQFCSKKENIKKLDLAEVYIRKKLSVEHILLKLGELEKIKFLFLGKEDMYLMNYMKTYPVYKVDENM